MTTTPCTRCHVPVWANAAGGYTSGDPGSGCSTTCGSTWLLHTLDANPTGTYEFRPVQTGYDWRRAWT